MAKVKEKAKKRLTKKQHGFVKDYLETGNGSLAVKKNYDIQDDGTARSIAHENLTKPHIAEVIEDALSDENLKKAHSELLMSTRLDHMVFPMGPKTDKEKKVMDALDVEAPIKSVLEAEQMLQRTDLTDEDITAMLKDVNCTVRRIVHGQTARHVYFWSADNKARKDALDMAYKLKGSYAPDKQINVNVELEATDEIKKITEHLNALQRGTSQSSNGTIASPVGEEIQHTE